MPNLETRVARLEEKMSYLGNAKIRDEIVKLLDTALQIETSIQGDVGTPGPREGFTVTLTLSNPARWHYGSLAVDGMALRNIRLYLCLNEGEALATHATLLTPSAGGVLAFDNPNCRFPPLSADAKTTSMYLCARLYLEPGQSQTIWIKGKVFDTPAGVSNFRVIAKAYADPDLDWLFPKDQDSKEFPTDFTVSN